MKLLNTQSLAKTIDAVNEAFFLGELVPKAERGKVSRWIADRQGERGSYANMFAPTKRDFTKGLTLFTGETVSTQAAVSHILGEEAARALLLLQHETKQVADALHAATVGIFLRLRKEKRVGMYCCGKCTVALWRHVSAGGFAQADPERLLIGGMKQLHLHRDGKGKWRVFPYYYTLLALSEMALPAAIEEMRYARRGLKRLLRRSARGDTYDTRRRLLAERVLAKC